MEVVDRRFRERGGVPSLREIERKKPTRQRRRREGYTDAQSTPHDEAARTEQLSLDLDEIARQGARKMLAQALQAEVDAYLKAAEAEQRDEHGHALVVRNGYHNERQVLCGAGSIEVRAPRINDKRVDETTGERKRFKSAILPPYTCAAHPRSPRSCRYFTCTRALDRRLHAGLGGVLRYRGWALAREHHSPHRAMQHEREAFFEKRDLSGVDYVYVWVDGIHTRVRLSPDERLCCLVMVGVRLDGKKELVAVRDGYRESEESWAEFLRDLKKRGMRAPVLAIGDGALGFWGALRDAFPETRHQRDWVHKTANVLDALPKSVHGRAKKTIKEIKPRRRTSKKRERR